MDDSEWIEDADLRRACPLGGLTGSRLPDCAFEVAVLF